MKLLALDQASRISGWAVFEEGKLVDYGKITLKPEEVGKRLVILRDDLKELISTYNIDYIAFEDIQLQNSVGNNVQTFKTLASVYGVVLELCEELKIDYQVVSSQTWKSTLGIKGRQRAEQKSNAQQYVVNTYGVRPTQDECDAICIGSHIVKTDLGSAW